MPLAAPQIDCPHQRAGSLAGLSALQQLPLSNDDVEALTMQGYVQVDKRGNEQPGYARLRFRAGGKTRTVYLGGDHVFVQQVKAELEVLRRPARARREALQFAKEGRRTLRRIKQQLTNLLPQVGMHLHGDRIRKDRYSRLDDTTRS
jgi:hypothetical protein